MGIILNMWPADDVGSARNVTPGPERSPRIGSSSTGVARRLADDWIERYETMMAGEVPHRAEQIEVVAAVARQRLAAVREPWLLELGCGPATLARRLADALPDLEVIAVDADPLLLMLAGAVAHPRVRTVKATVGRPGWTRRLPCDGGVDLAVAVAVVHYLGTEDAGRWYRDVAGLLRPGGALVLADAFLPPCATDSEGAVSVADPVRTVSDTTALSWTSWWAAVDADPDLRAWRGPAQGPTCDGDALLHTEEHRAALQAAGFGRIVTRWRRGRHAVLLAERR